MVVDRIFLPEPSNRLCDPIQNVYIFLVGDRYFSGSSLCGVISSILMLTFSGIDQRPGGGLSDRDLHQLDIRPVILICPGNLRGTLTTVMILSEDRALIDRW